MEQQINEAIPQAPVNTAEVYGRAVAAAHNEFVAELTTTLADARGQIAVLSALNENLTQDNARLAENVEKLEAEVKRLSEKAEVVRPIVAYEYYNPKTGHALVDYSEPLHHRGYTDNKEAYEVRPLVFASK